MQYEYNIEFEAADPNLCSSLVAVVTVYVYVDIDARHQSGVLLWEMRNARIFLGHFR